MKGVQVVDSTGMVTGPEIKLSTGEVKGVVRMKGS